MNTRIARIARSGRRRRQEITKDCDDEADDRPGQKNGGGLYQESEEPGHTRYRDCRKSPGADEQDDTRNNGTGKSEHLTPPSSLFAPLTLTRNPARQLVAQGNIRRKALQQPIRGLVTVTESLEETKTGLRFKAPKNDNHRSVAVPAYEC